MVFPCIIFVIDSENISEIEEVILQQIHVHCKLQIYWPNSLKYIFLRDLIEREAYDSLFVCGETAFVKLHAI